MATQEERRRASIEAVIEAATKLFGADGYHATSVNRIAEAAGVSKSGLLHHFGSKDELFRQVFIRLEEELVSRSVTDLRDAGPRQILRAGTGALLTAFEDPSLRRIVLIDGPAVLGWVQWRQIQAERGIGVLTAILTAAHEQGDLDIEPSEAAAHMLLAALHEAAFALVDDPAARPRVEALLDRLVGSLFRSSA